MNSPFAIEYHVQQISMVHNVHVFVLHFPLIHVVILKQVIYNVNKDGLESIVIKVRLTFPNENFIQLTTLFFFLQLFVETNVNMVIVLINRVNVFVIKDGQEIIVKFQLNV
jgi:hypothetical protein